MAKGEVDYTKTAPGVLLREKVERMGYALYRIDRWSEMARAQGVRIFELRVRFPSEERPEALVVVKAMKEGERLVGFHSAGDPSEAIKGAIERVENGTMVWRFDTFATDLPSNQNTASS